MGVGLPPQLPIKPGPAHLQLTSWWQEVGL